MASSTSGESSNNNMWQGTAESIATANREQAEAAEARSRQYLASGELERAHRFASKAMRLDVHRSGLRSLLTTIQQRIAASPHYCSACNRYIGNCVCGVGSSSGSGPAAPAPAAPAAAPSQSTYPGAAAEATAGRTSGGSGVTMQGLWRSLSTFRVHPRYRKTLSYLLLAIAVLGMVRYMKGGPLVGGGSTATYDAPYHQQYSGGQADFAEAEAQGSGTKRRAYNTGEKSPGGAGVGLGGFGGFGLPGDISYAGESTFFYFPIVSCVLFSVLGNVVMRLFRAAQPATA